MELSCHSNSYTQRKKMRSDTILPKVELLVYCAVWISAVLYALFQLYGACQQYMFRYNCDDIFEDGWRSLNRKVDHTDYEWKAWTRLLFQLLPWFFLHLIGAEVFRRLNATLLLSWYIFVTISCVSYIFSFQAFILLFVQLASYFLLACLKSKLLIWSFFVSCTIFQTSLIDLFLPSASENELNLVFIILSWLHLKCVSFSSYVISSKDPLNLLFIFSYCFYLPCFALGPIILYEDFISNVLDMHVDLKERSSKAILNFFRFSFWYYFTEFSLHFIYIGVLPHQLEIFNLNPWAMCGLGFALGIFFYLKYIVVYGICGSVVQFEGYCPPSPPRCIACIHLYSDMWRYFDCGLHKFIKDCIYLPLSDYLKPFVPKLFISFVCFSFIFLWHGLHTYVLIWSSLNFLGLVVEIVCKNISRHPTYLYHRNKILSLNNQRRFHALLAAPLTIMSAVSNFYFFGEGMEVGSSFVMFLCESSMSMKLILLVCMYTLSQVSIEYSMTQKIKTK